MKSMILLKKIWGLVRLWAIIQIILQSILFVQKFPMKSTIKTDEDQIISTPLLFTPTQRKIKRRSSHTGKLNFYLWFSGFGYGLKSKFARTSHYLMRCFQFTVNRYSRLWLWSLRLKSRSGYNQSFTVSWISAWWNPYRQTPLTTTPLLVTTRI